MIQKQQFYRNPHRKCFQKNPQFQNEIQLKLLNNRVFPSVTPQFGDHSVV